MTTGIAICFDTWAGNTLPDGADIEGIIVRVDNVTILRQEMPTVTEPARTILPFRRAHAIRRSD
jgi:hypothetical protein